MTAFGKSSMEKLVTCHPDLQRLFLEVVKTFDCVVLCGTRSKDDQEKAFIDGATKEHWPNSKHNSNPSIAIDVAPYPVDWGDFKRFYFFGGVVKGTANVLGINVRWGGDWD